MHLAHSADFTPLLLDRKKNNNGMNNLLAKGIYWFGSVHQKRNVEAQNSRSPPGDTQRFCFCSRPLVCQFGRLFHFPSTKGIFAVVFVGVIQLGPLFCVALLLRKTKRPFIRTLCCSTQYTANTPAPSKISARIRNISPTNTSFKIGKSAG